MHSLPPSPREKYFITRIKNQIFLDIFLNFTKTCRILVLTTYSPLTMQENTKGLIRRRD